jgi:hypothetical protein
MKAALSWRSDEPAFIQCGRHFGSIENPRKVFAWPHFLVANRQPLRWKMLWTFAWSHFLDANRQPLRWKMLWTFAWSHFLDANRQTLRWKMLWTFAWSHFLDANRCPLRWKILQSACRQRKDPRGRLPPGS